MSAETQAALETAIANHLADITKDSPAAPFVLTHYVLGIEGAGMGNGPAAVTNRWVTSFSPPSALLGLSSMVTESCKQLAMGWNNAPQ